MLYRMRYTRLRGQLRTARLGQSLTQAAPPSGVCPGARHSVRREDLIRPGLQAEVLSIAILDGRFARTSFLDSLEASRARKALEEDRRWLRAKRARKR